MHKYVAIRKDSTFSESPGLSFSDKKQQLIDLSINPPKKDELIALGFTEVRNFDDDRKYEKDIPLFKSLGHVDAYVIEDPNGPQRMQDALQDDFYVVPNEEFELFRDPGLVRVAGSIPNMSDRQWPEITGIKQAHENGIKGNDVLVAVLDTGCDNDHVQLRRKNIDFRYFSNQNQTGLQDRRAFDSAEHGTHVAGIIAGRSIGIAPDVRLMVASVIESGTTKTSLVRILNALNWVVSYYSVSGINSAIVNMSLGFTERALNSPALDLIMKSIRKTLGHLYEHWEILPVVAIGNEGKDTYRAPGYFDEVLSVGATDHNGRLVNFSGGGLVKELGNKPVPDVVGVGSKVYSSYIRTKIGDSKYARMSGTSMSAPYVSGIAALYADNYNLRGKDLKQKLIETALPFNHFNFNLTQDEQIRYGNGFVRYVHS